MCFTQITKLENTSRLLELAPKETLLKVGFQKNMILCDIGSGTGVFAFEAAKISGNDIYALEVSQKLITLLEARKETYGLPNVKVEKVKDKGLPLKSNCCDMALLVTVLHELEARSEMLSEVKRILKDNGKLLIIEFHEKQTPMGPPISHRIGEDKVERLCIESGFQVWNRLFLGDNFYGILFKSEIDHPGT